MIDFTFNLLWERVYKYENKVYNDINDMYYFNISSKMFSRYF